MNDEDEELHRPSTSGRGELLSDEKPPECTKESTRLNNNVLNGYGDSDCCTGCDTTAQRDHMIAASLVYCDQEDVDDSNDDDNCCIYTYRGDRQEPAVENIPVDDRSASPLMDYLEMDFDPEPTVGIDSEGEDIIVNETPRHYNSEILINTTEEPLPCFSGANVTKQENRSSTKNEINGVNKSIESPISNLSSPSIPHIGSTGSKEERTGCLRRTADTMEVCQKLKRMRVEDLSCVKEMVWSESDAQHQLNQVGVSARDATSVINTLLALRIPFNVDHIVKTIGTCLHDETAPLIPYLESRAVAGCMPQDLVRTLETETGSLVSARFFATHQNLDMPIAPWLANWIKKGAVPILTLNLQRATTARQLIADSWDHQMIYGIEYNPLRPECAQIYLTNPLGVVSLEALLPQLISPSTLMIRRNDVLSRWTPHTDLMPLATHPNRHWHRFNVLGQVVNILREEQEDVQHTNHIVIPANYKSGITLAIRTSSVYSHELKSVPEL